MATPLRRIHDAHFKTKQGRLAVVLEAFKGIQTLAQLISEFGIHAQMITERTDFYGLSKGWRIIFVIFFAPLHNRINSVDKFVAYSV